MKKYKSHKQYRLPTRTYAEEGAYFITICTKDRECFFGDIIDNQLIKNSITEIVETNILELSDLWQDLMLDAWIIMPNHIHLLLVLGNINFTPVRSLFLGERVRNGLCPLIPNSISSIINHFKGKVTKKVGEIHADFAWQTRFHDHIIRDVESYQKIKNYIEDNPNRWDEDCFRKPL